jgi:hypothetical protein
LTEIGAIAEEAWAASCEVLGIPGDSPRLNFLICRDVTELFRVERLLDLPYAADPMRRGRICPGGFYPEVPMIAVVDVPQRRMGIAAHEIAHWATFQVTRSCPMAIGEGLAEYVKHTVLKSHPDIDDPSIRESMGMIRDPVLGIALMDAPPEVQARVSAQRAMEWAPDDVVLRPLFDIGEDEFGARQYALSWCLADVLCRLELERPGSLRTMLEHCSLQEPWAAFVSAYDEERVQELWTEQVSAVAKIR